MTTSMVEQTTVSEGARAAKLVVMDLKPLLDRLNILYDSEGGVKKTMGQDSLDQIESFSGLTKQQLDDGMYVLTATLREAINNAYSMLVELAARA